MRSLSVVLLALSAFILLLSSCSRDRENLPVAEVGDRVITLGVFEKSYATVDPKFLPAEEGVEGYKEFLNTMINKDVMAIKAEELGYAKDPYVIQGMEAFKKVGLQAAYLKHRVADKIDVTEKELKDAYELYRTTLQVKQIFVDTKPIADEVYSLLQGGADFESVCQRYSTASDASVGGQVISAVWGTFEPEFQDLLFSTPVGGVTPPHETRWGWVLVKVLEKNQPNRKPYEQAKPELEKLLRRLEEIRLTNDVTDDIRARHNFQWYDENIAIAFEAIPPDRPLTSPPDRQQEVYPLLKLDERDLDKPLVSYDNKTITVRDFSDLYDRSSFFTRPRRENRYADIKKFLMEVVMSELVAIEMRESRIEEEPDVKLAFDKKREQFMVDKLYQDLVAKQTEVSPEEVAAYYNDNIERFRRPEERRFGVILTGEMQGADEALKMVRSGVPFDSVAVMFSIPELTEEERVGTQFYSRGQRTEIDDAGFALEKVGDVSEPFETSRGWMVLKLKERRPERIVAADDAAGEISQAVQTLKNEERLNSLLEKWRTEMKIEIYEDNLKKAEIQPRTAGKGTK